MHTVRTAVTHEIKVAKFYGTGIDGYHEYHNGYLNFGLWERAGITYEQAAENLIRMVGLRMRLGRNSILLDIGCGMGTQDVFLATQFRPRSIHAIDITLKHVECAEERARRANIPNNQLQFYRASGTALPFPDKYFT